jgi:aryl-alcohol dehydrogenase-like predicted oxidoreductase
MGDAGRKDEGAMQYAHLGRTGLQVSRLGLGTLAFGWKTSEAESFAIMDQALELGINLIDTANVYGEPQPPAGPRGEGIAEQIIGRWLAQGSRRERIVLATKVYQPMGPGPNDRGLSAYRRWRRWCSTVRSSTSAAATSPGGTSPPRKPPRLRGTS